MRHPVGDRSRSDQVHMKLAAHTKIPWAYWGSKYKPSLIVGTVRISRRMLLGLVDELMSHLPEDRYDLTPVKEALALAEKDTVMEVGLPEDRTNVTTDVKKVSEVPPEGGLWVTFSLGQIKESK